MKTVAAGLIGDAESVAILPRVIHPMGMPNGMFAIQFDQSLYRAPASSFLPLQNHIAVGVEFPVGTEPGTRFYTLDPAEAFAPRIRLRVGPGFHEGMIFNPWFMLPGPVDALLPDRVRTAEISGAAASNLPDRAVLVSDGDPTNVYDYDFASNTIARLPFPPGANNSIADIEGLTRRDDGFYYVTASLSRNTCASLDPARLRLGRFLLADVGTENPSIAGF